MDENPYSLIFLVGLPGSGKSAVGRMLSKRLGFGFADTDTWIERAEQRRIFEIFEMNGEEYFRNLENQVVGELKDWQNRRLEQSHQESCHSSISAAMLTDIQKAGPAREIVISTGGGMFQASDNREILNALGTTLYLKCDTKVIAERLAEDSGRPLLINKNSSAANNRDTLIHRLNSLIEARQSAYLETDFQVDTSTLTTREVVDSIICALKCCNQA